MGIGPRLNEDQAFAPAPWWRSERPLRAVALVLSVNALWRATGAEAGAALPKAKGRGGRRPVCESPSREATGSNSRFEGSRPRAWRLSRIAIPGEVVVRGGPQVDPAPDLPLPGNAGIPVRKA